MKFVVGVIRYWAFNLVAWAAAIGGIAYFLGLIEDVNSFFRDHRSIMAALLLLHFALCAIIYDASGTQRDAAREIKRLGKS